VAIGSRYCPGGGVKDWPVQRRFMSWAVNTYARWLLGLKPKDTSGGYRCYRVDLLRRTNLDRLLSYGYSFQEEALYRMCRAGATVGETPIIFEDRRAGASKVNYGEVARSLSILCWLGMQSIFGLDREIRSQQSGVRSQATRHRHSVS
jgi:dolichol-phosphate mannosyltransferase